MPWRGPEYEGEFPSLGWGLVEYFEEHLKVPAGPLYGKQLKLTPDQVQFFVRLYAIRPAAESGRFVYRRAMRCGPKGKGKSPEGGMFVIGEFAGPVQFDGWDADGEPVGRARDYPWVQVCAVAEEQDHNLYGPMREMLIESDLVDTAKIDPGETRVKFRDRPGKIEPVTSSDGAREGQPITAAALEETGLWFPSRGGKKLAAVLRRNVGKTSGRSVEFTNPPAMGEQSVAEATMAAADKGEKGLLLDWAQGEFVEDFKDPKNRAKVLRSLRQAYDGGYGKRPRAVPWIELERQYEEMLDSDTTEADGYRYYLSLARKAENRAFDSRQFDSLADRPTSTRRWAEPGYEVARTSPSPVKADEPVVLMFDGARTRDCSVLSAWTLAEVPFHFHVASWVRPFSPDENYEHPRGEIRAAVREFLAEHDCVLFAFDSSFHELKTLYDDWVDEFGDLDPATGTGLMVEFPTASGQRMEKALKRIREDTRVGAYRHDGDPTITEHIHNAVAAKNRGGWLVLEKEKDSMKIDGAVTLTFGYDLIPAARDVVENRVDMRPSVSFA